MAKFGIALGSGPRGHGFKSRHSDQIAPFLSSFEKVAKGLVTIENAWLQGFFLLFACYVLKLFGIAVVNLVSESKFFLLFFSDILKSPYSLSYQMKFIYTV